MRAYLLLLAMHLTNAGQALSLPRMARSFRQLLMLPDLSTSISAFRPSDYLIERDRAVDVISANQSVAVCFSVPAGDLLFNLHSSMLRIAALSIQPVGGCNVSASLHDTYGHLGAPGSVLATASAPVAMTNSSDRLRLLTLPDAWPLPAPGTTSWAEGTRSGTGADVGGGSSVTSVPAIDLRGISLALQPGRSYCLSLHSPVCTVSMIHALRAPRYVSEYGFTTGPLLVANHSGGSSGDSAPSWLGNSGALAWRARGPLAHPDYGLPSLALRVQPAWTSNGTALTPDQIARLTIPGWNATDALVPRPLASPSPVPPSIRSGVYNVLAPVGSPVLSRELQGDLFLQGQEGLLACFVFLDARKAVRPYRVRFVPLSRRVEDVALVAGPQRADGTWSGDASMVNTTAWSNTSATVLISTARVVVHGFTASYRVVTRKTVTVPLPANDSVAVEVSVDAQYGGLEDDGVTARDAMNGGDGWCVGVGSVDGEALRLAHSDVPGGLWGPEACPNRGFNCYGVADYRGSPPNRLERIAYAPWLGVDVIETSARPKPSPSPSPAPALTLAEARLSLFGFPCDIYKLEQLRTSLSLRALRAALAMATGLRPRYVIVQGGRCLAPKDQATAVLVAAAAAGTGSLDLQQRAQLTASLEEATQVTSYEVDDDLNYEAPDDTGSSANDTATGQGNGEIIVEQASTSRRLHGRGYGGTRHSADGHVAGFKPASVLDMARLAGGRGADAGAGGAAERVLQGEGWRSVENGAQGHGRTMQGYVSAPVLELQILVRGDPGSMSFPVLTASNMTAGGLSAGQGATWSAQQQAVLARIGEALAVGSPVAVQLMYEPLRSLQHELSRTAVFSAPGQLASVVYGEARARWDAGPDAAADGGTLVAGAIAGIVIAALVVLGLAVAAARTLGLGRSGQRHPGVLSSKGMMPVAAVTA